VPPEREYVFVFTCTIATILFCPPVLVCPAVTGKTVIPEAFPIIAVPVEDWNTAHPNPLGKPAGIVRTISETDVIVRVFPLSLEVKLLEEVTIETPPVEEPPPLETTLVPSDFMMLTTHFPDPSLRRSALSPALQV
jgi:hypothetical protein